MSLQQALLKTTRIPLYVPPDAWDARHFKHLRVVHCSVTEPPLPPRPAAAVLALPFLPPLGYTLMFPSLQPDALPFYRFRTGVGLLGHTLRSTPRGQRMFRHWTYPEDAAQRALPFAFGKARLRLEAEAVVRARCSLHARVPVLAYTLEGARRSAPKREHEVPAELRRRTSMATNGAGSVVGDSALTAHELAILVALAQAQYHWFVKRPSPPDVYRTFLICTRDGGTKLDGYAAHISARTIEAILDPHRPYVGSIDLSHFSLDLSDPVSFVDVLLRILEPWAVVARSALTSTMRHIQTDIGRSAASLATVQKIVGPKKKRGRQPSMLADIDVKKRKPQTSGLVERA